MPLYSIPAVFHTVKLAGKITVGEATSSTIGFYGTTPAVTPVFTSVTDVDTLVDAFQTIGILQST